MSSINVLVMMISIVSLMMMMMMVMDFLFGNVQRDRRPFWPDWAARLDFSLENLENLTAKKKLAIFFSRGLT